MKRRYKFLIILGIVFTLIVVALSFLGQFFGSPKPLPLTWSELRKITKKAEKGNGRACWCLALYYSDEDGKYKQWLEKSVEYGDPYGQFYMYSDLIAKHPDRKKEAIDFLIASAKGGYHLAERTLGDCYRDGKVIKKDLERAEYWYRRASLAGNIASMKELSKLLAETHSDKQGLIEAYKWLVVIITRSKQGTQFATDLRKQEAFILDKAAKLGFDKISVALAAQKLSSDQNQMIPYDLYEKSNAAHLCRELALDSKH